MYYIGYTENGTRYYLVKRGRKQIEFTPNVQEASHWQHKPSCYSVIRNFSYVPHFLQIWEAQA